MKAKIKTEAKTKVFWRDDEGFTVHDLEKIVTCILFTITTLAVVVKFIMTNVSDSDMTIFALGLGGLFVARKAFKYSLDKSTVLAQTAYLNQDESDADASI
jgi:hypothetical protein